jgi:hypothetical protein
LSIGEASSSSGHATPFKLHVNFDIPLFEGMIYEDGVDKWVNLSIEGLIYVDVEIEKKLSRRGRSLDLQIPHS